MGTFFNRPRREIIAELLDYLSSVGERSHIMDDPQREIFKTNIEMHDTNSQYNYNRT